jgi:ribosome-associated toxin RatA of RatAB toxin-antitoxin module
MSLRSLAFVLALAPSMARAAQPTILDEVPDSLRVGPSGKPLTLDETKDLLAGKVVADAHNDESEIRDGVTMVVVDATPRAVLDILHDWPHFPEFMPRVASATVDERGNDTWLVTLDVHTPLGIGDRRYQMRIVDEKKKLDGRQVWESHGTYTGKGNIRACKWTWTMVPVLAGAKTLVIYKSRFDPGGSIPKRIKAHEIDKATEDAVEAVRDRAAKKK